jgi:hypothetical protein
MFKQFSTALGLESWLQAITGNSHLIFQGRYGESPFFQSPQLWDRIQERELLRAPGGSHGGRNSISTYDLVRIITMLGWHHHLRAAQRLPGAQWNSLESIVRALGTDSARYADAAIDRLNIAAIIRSPVIISKLGFGRSSIRDRTELVYLALVQFMDQRNRRKAEPAIHRTVALAMLAAKDVQDINREARELDARMAAEVTEIMRRIITQELA